MNEVPRFLLRNSAELAEPLSYREHRTHSVSANPHGSFEAGSTEQHVQHAATPSAPLAMEDILKMDELGIRSLSGNFLYRQYRYQKLEHAIAYATLDRDRANYQTDVSVQPDWMPARAPNDADWRVMQQLGITFSEQRYHYLQYRYEDFQDAINQAHLMRARVWPDGHDDNSLPQPVVA